MKNDEEWWRMMKDDEVWWKIMKDDEGMIDFKLFGGFPLGQTDWLSLGKMKYNIFVGKIISLWMT